MLGWIAGGDCDCNESLSWRAPLAVLAVDDSLSVRDRLAVAATAMLAVAVTLTGGELAGVDATPFELPLPLPLPLPLVDASGAASSPSCHVRSTSGLCSSSTWLLLAAETVVDTDAETDTETDALAVDVEPTAPDAALDGGSSCTPGGMRLGDTCGATSGDGEGDAVDNTGAGAAEVLVPAKMLPTLGSAEKSCVPATLVSNTESVELAQ